MNFEHGMNFKHQEMPGQVLVLDTSIGRKFQDKRYYLRLTTPTEVKIVDLDKEMSMTDAWRKACEMGFSPSHWMDSNNEELKPLVGRPPFKHGDAAAKEAASKSYAGKTHNPKGKTFEKYGGSKPFHSKKPNETSAHASVHR